MLIAKKDPTSPELIALCGINCRLCRNYAREKKPCPGCRSEDTRYKSKACVTCKIKNCSTLAAERLEFCFECDQFPCAELVRLNKRYSTKFGLSPLENLNDIQEKGLDRFVERENTKWACPQCDSLLCMHKAECLACGYKGRA